METFPLINDLWHGIGWPLIRLIFFVSIGLMAANIIESLNWTHAVAKIASPLIRAGHLSDISGASFSMAFFSSVAANSMLAEAYDQGKLSDRELIFANLFNSLPTYFLHLPTLFFIAAPFIKGAAFIYVSLTLTAALFRTLTTIVLGRIFLPALKESCINCHLGDTEHLGFKDVLLKSWSRFKARIRRILSFTVPIYILIYLANKLGFFGWLENKMATSVTFLSWLHPQTLSIVTFHIAAEFTAGLAAAGALVAAGTIKTKELILALLIGNILSSPVRAIRHQFPYYAGIFNSRQAVLLIFYNQSFRTLSMMLVTIGYFFIGS
jgi:hypothetical protein